MFGRIGTLVHVLRHAARELALALESNRLKKITGAFATAIPALRGNAMVRNVQVYHRSIGPYFTFFNLSFAILKF